MKWMHAMGVCRNIRLYSVPLVTYADLVLAVNARVVLRVCVTLTLKRGKRVRTF